MIKTKSRASLRAPLLVLAAVVLVGGSFAVASGSISTSPSSLLASVIAVFSGRPIVFIGRDGASPRGSISMGVSSNLGTFDISARNVTHSATVNYLSTQVTITSTSAAPLSIASVLMSYTYCIPHGVKYGYGYASAGCATRLISASSLTKSGANYIANFYTSIPVYPQQSYGAFSIFGTPTYSYTGTTTNTSARNASLVVEVTGASASGDQCARTWVLASHTYGYTGCVASNAIVNIQAGKGNPLTVVRSYGYGYYAHPPTPKK